VTVERVHRTARDAAAQMLAPLLAARPGPTQWRLAGIDCDAGIAVTLVRGEAVLLVEIEARDEARACYARTARFNVNARRAFAPGELDLDERRAIDRLVALLTEREASVPAPVRATASHRAAVRVLDDDQVLVDEGTGHYALNPYVGCTIGCAFCYAAARADLTRALEGAPRLEWGRWVDVKEDAPDVLRRELAGRAPGIVRLSPIVTDPYQPLERRYRLTRRCLEVLLDAGFTPIVLTRCAAVLDDLELLARFPRAAVGFSIPTDDDRVREAFEPGADPIDARLAALERCARAGLRTFVVVQPVLPMDPERLVARVAPHVRAVRIDRMHDPARVLHLYQRAGRLDAATDAFFERTAVELRARFAERGVTCDGSDDVAAALGLVPHHRRYDELYAASAAGDARRAHAAFLRVVGLAPRRTAVAVPQEPRPPRTISALRYDDPREVDLIALERGARPAIKLEDLDTARAEAVEARLRARGFATVRGDPYRKRFDVPEAYDTGAARGLVNLYAARAVAAAAAVAGAERDRTPDGTRRAGLALGYPPCCVERFVALERDPARDEAGLNELALRALAGDEERAIPWELNPLSSCSPIGFFPCAGSCEAALACARGILAALREADPVAHESARAALLRPILFFRYPLFWVLDWVLDGAEPTAGGVRYREALANDDGTPTPPVLRAWAWDEIGSVLAAGDEIRIDAGSLEVLASGRPLARWTLTAPRVPRLLRFA
jgi:DNA repair photolyase